MTPALVLAAGLVAAPPAGGRTFTLTTDYQVTGLPAGGPVRVWVPVPPTDAEQAVEVLARTAPGTSRLTREPEYGNSIWYVEAAADAGGNLALSARYRVTRRPAAPTKAAGPADRFLRPDRLVPVGGKPAGLLAGKDLPADPAAKARAVYDLVFAHMRYRKDVAGWGRGDAAWACDSRAGNCSDFHSLFISLARARGLPAAFEVGYGLPIDRGKGEVAGYHCWAKVLAGGEWLPADVSEPSKLGADAGGYFGRLPPNRVRLSTGRDVTLEPRQAGGPLNFFVDPYAEAGGTPVPADRVTAKVTFADE